MTRFVVRLNVDDSPAWSFLTREHAEEWCEQFGNTFTITEVDDE
jgi:hypothetical protein